MKIPSKLRITLASLLGSLALTHAQENPAAPEPPENGPRIQLALLLDTSSSMSGLIDQARAQIWQIVNTFIDAKQNGQTPYVEVALYEYGNSSLDAKTHWIRRLQPLTRDLDAVSADLFALTTRGGEEYCGAVIRQSLEELAWDSSPDTYKAIFIAGNEAFTQGPIDAQKACRDAIAKGIIVNTIHCGTESAGANSGWKDGALLADGRYLVIDHNQALVQIDTPQDAPIAKLNEELNRTYLPWGKEGRQRAELQVSQDQKADEKLRSSLISRAASKASSNYINAAWDLVDAAKEKDFDLKQIPAEELPAPMQAMQPEKRAAFIQEKSGEREKIQKQILELNQQRNTYLQEKRAEMAAENSQTLDSVMVATVRSQAEKKGIVFEKD